MSLHINCIRKYVRSFLNGVLRKWPIGKILSLLLWHQKRRDFYHAVSDADLLLLLYGCKLPT